MSEVPSRVRLLIAVIGILLSIGGPAIAGVIERTETTSTETYTRACVSWYEDGADANAVSNVSLCAEEDVTNGEQTDASAYARRESCTYGDGSYTCTYPDALSVTGGIIEMTDTTATITGTIGDDQCAVDVALVAADDRYEGSGDGGGYQSVDAYRIERSENRYGYSDQEATPTDDSTICDWAEVNPDNVSYAYISQTSEERHTTSTGLDAAELFERLDRRPGVRASHGYEDRPDADTACAEWDVVTDDGEDVIYVDVCAYSDGDGDRIVVSTQGCNRLFCRQTVKELDPTKVEIDIDEASAIIEGTDGECTVDVTLGDDSVDPSGWSFDYDQGATIPEVERDGVGVALTYGGNYTETYRYTDADGSVTGCGTDASGPTEWGYIERVSSERETTRVGVGQ